MVNKAMLIGNLGSDPEVRYTASGAAVANFSIATSERWKDSNGERKEETTWHRIVAWKRHAELAGEYLKKGSKVYIEGPIKHRKWEDNDGNTRYTTEITVRQMEFLDGRKDSGSQERSSRERYAGEPAEPPPVDDSDVPF